MLVLDSGAVTKLASRGRRSASKQGSAAGALVVAIAEPAGRLLTGDPEDLRALAAEADHVVVEPI